MLKKIKNIVHKIVPSKKIDPILFDDDVFLVSYPKSGNTWVRFLLGNYLSNNNCDFINSHLIIPDIDYNPESIIHCTTHPRIIKSHRRHPQPYKRIIYLLRDGRDVAVSYFYHLKKYSILPSEIEFQEYILKFVNGTLDNYGPWGDHVTGWLDDHVKDIIIIRYEDLKNAPITTFTKIINFCGFFVDQDRIVKAIAASNITRMKYLEQHQHKKTELLSKSDPSIQFVRKGTIGDWNNHFDKSTLNIFLDSFGTIIDKYNYSECEQTYFTRK